MGLVIHEEVQTHSLGGASVHQSKSGRRFGITSLLMATVSVALAPVVFGVLGIIFGMIAVIKGERYLGMLGVSLSAVLAVTGYYIAGELLT